MTPPSFVNEGLAQLYSFADWSSPEFDDLAAIGLEVLTAWSASVDRKQDELYYAAAAAFVSRLVDRFGLPRVVAYAVDVARDAALAGPSGSYFWTSLATLWQDAFAGPVVMGSCRSVHECATAPEFPLDGAAWDASH